jgi:hypothetical protein
MNNAKCNASLTAFSPEKTTQVSSTCTERIFPELSKVACK